MADPSVKIIFLGGLGEVGRNCACIEVNGRLIMVDCGVLFPELDMLGIDLVLPDFSFVRENAHRLAGLVLTHGHEDHIGAIAYLLRNVDSLDIYGSPLAIEFARGRVVEHGLSGRANFIAVQDNEIRDIGAVRVEFIPVTHSVPEAFALAIHTPLGVVLHTGDFKIDHTPVDGRKTNLARIGEIASTVGVKLLLSDSTKAEEPGFSDSESSIKQSLGDVITQHPGRVIAASFASHIHRIQQLADVAVDSGRYIAVLGRSMKRNISIARQLGALKIPEDRLIDIEQTEGLRPREVLVVSTGSQGEPMSALSLMAAGENRWITLYEDDLVLLSSHAVPGNETAVGRVIDKLMRKGVRVVHSGIAKVHVSGHGRQGDLSTMMSVARPQNMIPVHGEYRHMWHNAELAMRMGLPESNVLICQDGDVVELTDSTIAVVDKVPAGYTYVDGTVGDVVEEVIRDRQVLAEEGLVVLVLTVDAKSGKILYGPEIVTKGWIHAPEAEELLDEARQAVTAALEGIETEGVYDPEIFRRRARRALGKFVAERTRRRPMIVPVVTEV